MRDRPHAKRMGWIAANALIASLAIVLYWLWQPILTPLKGFFAPHSHFRFSTSLVLSLFYPVSTSGYFMPDRFCGLLLVGMQIWCAVAPPKFIRDTVTLRRALALCATGYLLAAALILTHIYPEAFARHTLWVWPLAMPFAGLFLGEALSALCRIRVAGKKPDLKALALALLALCCLDYNPKDRFGDWYEYLWPRHEWQAFTEYMETLGPDDVVVAEKDAAIMLTSLYPYMRDDAFSGRHMATLVDYRNTHILFNPYFPDHYSRHVLMATLEEAEKNHLLDHAKRIVFLRMAWSHSPINDLMVCPLDELLVPFPPFVKGEPLNRDDIIIKHQAVLLFMDRQAFLTQLMAKDSPGRACMTGEHDVAPAITAPVTSAH